MYLTFNKFSKCQIISMSKFQIILYSNQNIKLQNWTACQCQLELASGCASKLPHSDCPPPPLLRKLPSDLFPPSPLFLRYGIDSVRFTQRHKQKQTYTNKKLCIGTCVMVNKYLKQIEMILINCKTNLLYSN